MNHDYIPTKEGPYYKISRPNHHGGRDVGKLTWQRGTTKCAEERTSLKDSDNIPGHIRNITAFDIPAVVCKEVILKRLLIDDSTGYTTDQIIVFGCKKTI